ncbi:MAG: hypothetical protein GXX10_05550 [Clostridiaceae bacterium]|nr:hypothetical protein [Clostridiaceae bacterium]
MNKERITTLKVAGTYIGTVVGAGFASGQEVLQFFVCFGKMGFWGLLVVTLLFIFFGYIIMELGITLKASNHLPIVMKTGGRIIGRFSDAVITFFLFGALTAMIAGSGAIFTQEFHLHPLIGSLFMAVITAITVLGGFHGIINSISFVVPFLIIAVVGVSIASIITSPTHLETSAIIPKGPFLRNWLWASILYLSYNTVPSISILGPLGYKANSRRIIRNGAILGGLGLGIGAFAIFISLYSNAKIIKDVEIPMLVIAGGLSPVVKILYSVVLLAEIYTTAVSDLYGFSARICNNGKGKKHINSVILASIAAAFVLSLAGFSNLVKYMYPFVGYLGVITLICIIYHRYKA